MPLLFKSKCDRIKPVIKFPTAFKDGNSVSPKKPEGRLRLDSVGESQLYKHHRAHGASARGETQSGPERRRRECPAQVCLEDMYGSNSPSSEQKKHREK